MKTVSNFVTYGCFITYLWENYFILLLFLIQIHQEGESPKTLEGDNWCWTFGFHEGSVNFCNFFMFQHISLTKLFCFTPIPYSDPSRGRVTWNLKRWRTLNTVGKHWILNVRQRRLQKNKKKFTRNDSFHDLSLKRDLP